MPYRSSVNIAVNGQQQSLEVDHQTRSFRLRDHPRSDRGQTRLRPWRVWGVHGPDGQPVYACHLLAMQVRGRSVVTIEGLAEQADFRRVLEAFVSHDGGQRLLHTRGLSHTMGVAAPSHG